MFSAPVMDSVIGLAKDRLVRESVSSITPLAAAFMYVASFVGRFSPPSSFILHRTIPISLLPNRDLIMKSVFRPWEKSCAYKMRKGANSATLSIFRMLGPNQMACRETGGL